MFRAQNLLLAGMCLAVGCIALAGCALVERSEPVSEYSGSLNSVPAAIPSTNAATTTLRQHVDQHSLIQPVVHVQPAPTVAQPETVVPLPAPRLELPPESLTLEQLEDIAISVNPALAEAAARVNAARGKWVQVGLPPNTVLGYSGQQLGSHGLAEQHGVFLQQEFVRGGKLGLNREVVSREIEQAEQQLAAQQQRVLTDVRMGFYDVLIAQRRIEVTLQLVDIARQGISTAEALFEAKEVSQVDVTRARIESQSAELLHQNAQNQYTAAWSRLTAVLGDANIAPVILAGDLEAINEHLELDDALRRIISESPEMAVALTEVERSRWAIDRAHAEPIPNVDVQAIMQSDNGTGSNNANLQVSMPIPWLDRNQGGIREAEANLFAAERAVGRLQLSLKQRLASVFQQYATARNQVREYSKQEGILANSDLALGYVRKGYQAGESGYLDLLTAQRTYSQTNLAYLEALGQLWSATVEIDGLLLKGSLTNPE